MRAERLIYFENPQGLLAAVKSGVLETEVVLDLGCGIVPSNFFRPKLHILVEPWEEYANVLAFRYQGDKSVLILKAGALEAIAQFQSNSVDSIFLLDVIEHLEKADGMRLLNEMERVARQQIVVFTPLGFMPQHLDLNEKDAWGLAGGEMQLHRSGWLPSDFAGDWTFYVCERYHTVDFRGAPLEREYGAFYAVRTFHDKAGIERPAAFSDIRRPLPSEEALERLGVEHESAKSELANAREQLRRVEAEFEASRREHAQLRGELERIRGSVAYRLLRRVKALLRG